MHAPYRLAHRQILLHHWRVPTAEELRPLSAGPVYDAIHRKRFGPLALHRPSIDMVLAAPNEDRRLIPGGDILRTSTSE